MQSANNPLFIEDFSVEANEITRGATAKRDIIVKNLGDKKADIVIWIAVGDAKAEPLLRWCNFSEKNPLKLEPKDERKVTLLFEVPAQANPGLYNYEILIEAPVQYPDKLFRRPQQIRVSRAADRDGEWDTEPGFTLQPLTSSTNPYLLQVGDKLEVKVTVRNRSKRVDRFYLICPELTHDWYSVRYPESSIETAGLVQETDGLQLNPGNAGEITLILHPPHFTTAGNYFPTVRLISRNREDLVLLDLVYLQLLADETLDVQLHPLSLRIPTENGVFEVKLTNQGNITREIAIAASDRDRLFNYTPEFPAVLLSPQDSSNIPFKVQPRKWWRRPFWGKALEFNFEIQLENNPVSLLPETLKPPALPKDLPQGTLIWEPRPWWQVLLPILLLLLLLLGLISVGAFLFWQKAYILPKINRVEPVAKVYQEIAAKPVNLNLTLSNWRSWEFKNWRFQRNSKLSTVKIIPQSRAGNDKIISYNYNDLLKFCQQVGEGLNCKNIPTETKQAGEYTFKIEVYPLGQNKPSDAKETDSIIIEPIATPKVIQFSSSKSIYREIIGEQVLLNWKISNPDRILNIIITQQNNNASPVKKTFIYCNPQNSQTQELQPKTNSIEKINNREFLVCQGVATNVTQPGDYTFKLEVFSKQNPTQPSDTKQTDTIALQPSPIPKVLDKILPNKANYEYKEPVFLNWRLSHPSQIKEMRIIQQGSDGSMMQNTLPLSQCKIQRSSPSIAQPNPPASTEPANNLDVDIVTCENIRFTPTAAGSYTYKLQVFSLQNPNQPSDTQETDSITVQPLPVPKITDISSTKPLYEAAKKEQILLNWKISEADRIRELRLISLAPDGSVNSPLQRYPINNTLPLQLRNFCTLTNNLICQNLPTGAKQAGDYTFKLTVIPDRAEGDTEIAKNTPTVKIKPVPPQPPKPATPVNIVYFKINGRDVSEKPKYVYEINKDRKPVDIIVSWKVGDGEDIKVELLPFGDVQKPEGAKTLTLSKPPSSITIALKVTNKAGEQKTQSVTIDTVEFSRLTQPQTPTPGGSAPGETAPGGRAPGGRAPGGTPPGGAAPSPSNPDRLSPIELPPKAD
ncbi:hypothetical protein QUB63_33220 [Microcoleus sp. ARI1-B5]|uniref:COG1470 family protein n=1 Tax=unclassified Microcoleus TaxID=2642155 RepID=UPI002FD2A759